MVSDKALRWRVDASEHTKDVQEILLLNTFSPVVTAEEFCGVRYRCLESMLQWHEQSCQ